MVQTLLEDFLKYESLNRRASEHTVAAYQRDLQQFIAYCTEQQIVEISEVTPRKIRNWITELHESGLVARSIHRKISALRSFTKYLRKQDLLQKDITANLVLPKMPKKLVDAIPALDIRDMFKNYPWEEVETGQRDRLLLLLFYSTGMRLSELIGLKKKDVDFYRDSLQVLGKRNKVRIIPIHPELKEYLQTYIQEAMPLVYVFELKSGKPLYPMYVYRLVMSYLRKFSTALKTSPHVLRHSFATHMLNNGADLMAIKEILGHASLAATQVYTKNSLEQLKLIYRKNHPHAK